MTKENELGLSGPKINPAPGERQTDDGFQAELMVDTLDTHGTSGQEVEVETTPSGSDKGDML